MRWLQKEASCSLCRYRVAPSAADTTGAGAPPPEVVATPTSIAASAADGGEGGEGGEGGVASPATHMATHVIDLDLDLAEAATETG